MMNVWKSGASWASEKLWVSGVEPFFCEYVCHMSSETERGRQRSSHCGKAQHETERQILCLQSWKKLTDHMLHTLVQGF